VRTADKVPACRFAIGTGDIILKLENCRSFLDIYDLIQLSLTAAGRASRFRAESAKHMKETAIADGRMTLPVMPSPVMDSRR